MDAEIKLSRLKDLLQEMGQVIIAYSGGVDSTFLLKVAIETIGDKALAITASSATLPESELEFSRNLASQINARHLIITTQELNNKEFTRNSPDRCYYCKKILFTKLHEIAQKRNINWILDGANYDDLNDYRPGRQAAKEMGVRSPLIEVGLRKDEIRYLSNRLGLPTWNKPAMACLSSRFPYGHPITADKLRQVELGENYLRQLGIREVRLRYHGVIARIEIPPDSFSLLLEPYQRERLIDTFKELGFTYVTLDLGGIRSGSMNEVLRPVSMLTED